MTGYIIVAASAAVALLVAALAVQGKRHAREIERVRREGEEDARRTAEIIAEANGIKEKTGTGDHACDMHVMADLLHEWSRGGK